MDSRTPETAVAGDLIGISDARDSGDHGGRWLGEQANTARPLIGGTCVRMVQAWREM